MADTGSRGRFVWYDLMTSDPGKAQDFYKTVVGWGTQVWDGAGMNYAMWTANGTPIGGVMDKQRPDIPAHWIAYTSVPDIDAAAKQVASLGGRIIVPPSDIPKVGRFAIAADPQGGVFALFTPADRSDRPDTKPAIGEFSWHELMADDYKKAWDFYQAIFGWERIEEHDMGPMGIYFIYGRNGVPLGGMFSKSPEMQMPANWMHYVRVDSADRVAEVVKANGGTVMNGPMDVPGGDRIAQCMDPQGAAFAIHAVKS